MENYWSLFLQIVFLPSPIFWDSICPMIECLISFNVSLVLYFFFLFFFLFVNLILCFILGEKKSLFPQFTFCLLQDLNLWLFSSSIFSLQVSIFHLYIFYLFPHLPNPVHIFLYILSHMEHIIALAFQTFLYAKFIISIIAGSVSMIYLFLS